MNILEPISYFDDFFLNKGEFKNLDLSLSRIESALCESMFNSKYLGEVIHIAGTNGKGSTSHILEWMLLKHGFKTALFTSPHINSVTERMRQNGDIISFDNFEALFLKCKNYIEKYNLSYFEALTFCALHWFSENKPDYTILETGLGGRFDATNVIDEKLPVITTIAKDHEAWLGKTIKEIAPEKTAIVKANKTVIVGYNTDTVYKIIEKLLTDKNIIRPDINFESELLYPYSKNHALSAKIFETLTGEKAPKETPPLPLCRCERFGQFILDGAHNPNGLQAVLKSGIKADAAVISSTADRDISKLVKILKNHVKHIIITSIPNNERSIKPNGLNIPNTVSEPVTEDALKLAVELAKNADILVCGSLYLCAEARKLIIRNLNK